MPSATNFITGALQDLGVLAAGASPEGADGSDALTVLNQMRDALGLERLFMHTVVRTTKTLAASTASYTIGSGGDINIVRPVSIDHAMLVIDIAATEPTEVPIGNLDAAEYAAWPQKALEASRPEAIYYDKSWSAGMGRIYPLPIPDVGTTQLVLYTPGVAVGSFADLTTNYTFPPGYERAIRKALALELAPSYPGAVISQLLVKQAAESKAWVKVANLQRMPLGCDPALTGGSGHWNIETDGRNR